MLVARNIYSSQVTLATVRRSNFSAGMPLGGQGIRFPDLNHRQLYLIHPSHKKTHKLPCNLWVRKIFDSRLCGPLTACLEGSQRTHCFIPLCSICTFPFSFFFSLNIPSWHSLFFFFPHSHSPSLEILLVSPSNPSKLCLQQEAQAAAVESSGRITSCNLYASLSKPVCHLPF